MDDNRRRGQQRVVRQLLHTLTGEGEPLIITKSGEVDAPRQPAWAHPVDEFSGD